ncbi:MULTISPECIES: helix-turn-helix transcriptional regulator [Burkholderiaceae]|uniref:helix-turn-helix transcriptional regulator n=1 Tax=Burkholderiaceae TaxID=119060 RepID=UPI0009692B2F|nr:MULTISPECIES: helix-turn-helix transcriptional regulator [Burkholderiaceae]MCG1019704.1 helix-turn-helix transcriptional regulator [Mycetohabitans sp. B4]SIT78886.1 transcriptional regulator, XRE family with shikimate kinase activity [Burkholderia sp. b13]
MKHSDTSRLADASVERGPELPANDGSGAGRDSRDPFLTAMGERVRLLRARRGMTRKSLAAETGLSERHLANLESGVGNASVLVLRQIALALNCPLAEVIGDETTSSAEWLLIRQLLHGRDPASLQRARVALADLFEQVRRDPDRNHRLALIGLRGAGKSTLGRMLAQERKVPFIELSRVIEQLAGGSPSDIHSLYGANAYRRYEHRALEAVIAEHPRVVIATTGGLVSEPATFNVLLAHCFTVWLQASPDEHMRRVIAQGDLRPMSGSSEAMEDLKRILAGRGELYGRADLSFDTNDKTLADAYLQLRDRLAVRLSADYES